MTHRVVFTPSGHDGNVVAGTTVLDAARHLGVDLDTVCGGRGICGRCQVTPSVGAFAKWGITSESAALGPLATIETDYRGNRPLAAGNRLGCAATIWGDIVIDVPATSQVHRQVVRKDLALGDVQLDPGFVLCYVEVPTAELGDSTTAYGAIRSAVLAQHGRTVTSYEPTVLSRVHEALHRGGGSVTVALRVGAQQAGDVMVAAWPGFVDTAVGIAVDVGSTTVAGHLCDLFSGEVLASAGRMNPQIRFGEDLMSRVSYVMMNSGGDAQLTAAIRAALGELFAELCDAAGVQADRVLDIVLVGNPVMHHILLGIDPTPLGQAPFVLATDEAVRTSAAAMGWSSEAPSASVYVGPCIAGHVGADTTAAILAEGPHRGEAMQLLVDIGTNAEIVLGDRRRQFAASSPTGPAFEGAQISAGQRATAGAIEKVRIDPNTLEPRVRVIGCELWSDEPGFDDAVFGTRDASGVTGICGSGIIDVIAEMYLAGIIDTDGVIQGSLAERSTRIIADGRTFSYVVHRRGDTIISVTQNDVRAIQLAKAALRAGIDLLVQHAGNPVVNDIRLAGAFGAHIDPVRAMVLGLVPDCVAGGVRSVGNAAGVGAVQALLSNAARRELESTARNVVKIETATEPGFQQLFVEAMAFPHATAATPHLADMVTLPTRATVEGADRSRRRRSAARVANRTSPGQQEAPNE